MRIFKIKHFAKWAKAHGISDSDLTQGVLEMNAGLIDADLGGGVVKKRIALAGMGKSGGARTLLATNFSGVWIFLVGFIKGERDNITQKELAALKMISQQWLSLPVSALSKAAKEERLFEIKVQGDI